MTITDIDDIIIINIYHDFHYSYNAVEILSTKFNTDFVIAISVNYQYWC